MKRRSSIGKPPDMSELNIILLGSTGAGKSTSGNTIIGGDRKTLREGYSPEAVTRVCQSAQTEVDGRTITVFDTVGLSDTSVKITDVQTEIEKMFTLHNLDVFLLVIRLGDKFTKEFVTAMKWIQENFGPKVLNHSIVLFTHGDQIHKPIEDYLSKCEALRSVVDQCSGGFHVFNNKDEDPSQVTELLEKIDKLREKNGYERYTEQDYKRTQDDLLHRKYRIGAAVGGVLGGAAGAAIATVRGAVALTVEKAAAIGVAATASGGEAGGEAGAAVALTLGKAALIGAAVGAALAAAAVCAGVYLLARKYTPRRKDKRH